LEKRDQGLEERDHAAIERGSALKGSSTLAIEGNRLMIVVDQPGNGHDRAH
jgi:hypothetical protein